MLIIASAVYISFVFYKTIAIYNQIDTMKKTTALVNACYKQGLKLRAYLEKIDGVKQKYKIFIQSYRIVFYQTSSSNKG